MKLFSLLLLISCNVICFALEKVNIPDRTPLFASDNLESRWIAVSNDNVSLNYSSKQKKYVSFPPFIREINIYQVVLNHGQNCYFSPELEIKKNGRLGFRFDKNLYQYFAGIFCVAAGLILLFTGTKTWFRTHEISKTHFYIFLIAPVLINTGLVLFIVSDFSGFYSLPSDELEYFKEAKELAAFNFTGPWRYTVGLPLFMIPVCLLTNGDYYSGFMQIFTWVNCLFVQSILIGCVFYILYRLFRNPCAAAWSLIGFFAMVIFYQHQFDGNDSGYLIRKAFFDLYRTSIPYIVYQKYVFFGINCLSDTLSACITALCTVLAFRLKRPLLVCAFLFGFACLVRMNNIFFAPLIFLLLFMKYKEKIKTVSGWIAFFATGISGFLLIYAFQLWIQHIQLGSMFHTPYIQHNIYAEPFASILKNKDSYPVPILAYLHSYFMGADYLLGLNFAYYVLGITGMTAMKDRFKRCILVLLTIPLTMFFMGYVCVTNNANRWILFVYPFLFASFFMVPVWQCENLKKNLIRSAACFIPILLIAPCSYFCSSVLPWNLAYMENGAVISWVMTAAALSIFLTGMFLFRKEKDELIFLGTFGLFFFSGSILLLLAACVWLMIRTVFDLFYCCSHTELLSHNVRSDLYV